MTRLHFHLLPLKRDTLDRSLPVCIPMNRDYDRQATGRPACSLIEGGQAEKGWDERIDQEVFQIV